MWQRRLDLNLLVSLDALLTTRSVTRAAEGLVLSQPTLSAALGRLRRHYGDELLVRSGNASELTPFAVQLAERVGQALAAVERSLVPREAVDLAASSRTFRLVGSDYVVALLGAPLADLVRAAAPDVVLQLAHVPAGLLAAGRDGLRGVDGVFVPHGYYADVPHLDVVHDTWVAVVDPANPLAQRGLAMEDLPVVPWVLSHHLTGGTPVSTQLQLLGVSLRAALVVDGFLAVPSLVSGSDRVGLVQGHLAARCPPSQVSVLPLPFDAIPLVDALWWSPVHDDDPEHRWLRSLVAQAARRVATGAATPGPV